MQTLNVGAGQSDEEYYAADIIALAVMFSVWSIGVHGFFVFKWFQGQKALKDLSEAPVSG